MSDRRKALALAGLLSVAAAAALATLSTASTAEAAPVTIPTAVADALQGQGQGLCVASAISMQPAIDFPQMAGVYNSGINAFMEAHKADRVEYVQRTIFDLSNNNSSGLKLSYGDFTDAMQPLCQTGGCDMFKNDTTTSFGSRFRGFINVTMELSNKPLHIGFYADDAVSLVIYDKAGNAYPIVTQPPVLGAPTWRMTETVTFTQTGLYPLEILYVEIVEHAALEFSFFTSDFKDFQLPANQVPITSLKTAGFTLFPETRFFQTLSGTPSYADLNECKQCDRQFVGQIGNNGCDSGYYCNEAALCAPCDTAVYCGPSCAPCGGMTPFCLNTNGKLDCASCRDSGDCKAGFSCDPDSHTCNECNVDADCAGGQTCVQHACQWCDTSDRCAGNSCNCCPKGSNGKQMQCLVLDGVACQNNADCLSGKCDVVIHQCLPEVVRCTMDDDCKTISHGKDVCDNALGQCVPPTGACNTDADCGTGVCAEYGRCILPLPECIECTKDADCTKGVCDQKTGQCVDQLAKNESSTCCGDDCLACPTDSGKTDFNPLCLPGPFGTACAACRSDNECASGSFCLSGQCTPCTKDRRCGTRCDSCGGDTPFCLDAQLPKDASCVRCNTDDECVGGHCDKEKHTCSDGCAMSCAPATPFCDGNACVECYADTQCPCANTCDLSTHTCSTSCKTNGDCQGDQHCQHADNSDTVKDCSPGPLPDNVDCGSTLADACSNSIGSRGANPTPAGGIAGLALTALLLRRRRSRGDRGARATERDRGSGGRARQSARATEDERGEA